MFHYHRNVEGNRGIEMKKIKSSDLKRSDEESLMQFAKRKKRVKLSEIIEDQKILHKEMEEHHNAEHKARLLEYFAKDQIEFNKTMLENF